MSVGNVIVPGNFPYTISHPTPLTHCVPGLPTPALLGTPDSLHVLLKVAENGGCDLLSNHSSVLSSSLRVESPLFILFADMLLGSEISL
jgi:hypothetical protein